MQWLIDIIIARAKTEIGYFDRGDVGDFDWEIGDFTKDWAWHDLDLSSIIPEGTRQVKFSVLILTGLTNRSFQIREKGNVGVVNRSAVWSSAASKYIETQHFVTPDAGRKVQYRVTAGFTGTLSVTVTGWWL